MAVHAQFPGGLVLQPPYAADEKQQMRALKDYGALLLSATTAATPTPMGDDAYAWQQYDYCAAQSELTCNNGGGVAAMPVPERSRKRVREEEDELLHYYAPLLPLTGTAASTSGRPAEIPAADALASELWRHDAEVDALVRAECDRLRAGLEVARKRQRHALVRAAVCGMQRRARDAEAQLDAARRRAAELEERVRLTAAEAQAWCGVARANEAVAAGLRATLDALLIHSSAGANAAGGEGFGESDPEDAQPAVSSSTAAKWTCRACGEGEASVLVLPCRHLCLCKACEPRADACPVCAGAKNAAIHIAPN